MVRVGVVLFPHFQMLAHALVTETLRLANRAAGEDRFRRRIFTATDAPISASNGAVVTPSRPLARADEDFDLMIAIAGYQPLARLTRPAADALALAARNGAALAGFDSGTVVLAHLGLLDGYRAVLHHDPEPGAEMPCRRDWPAIAVTDAAYCLDRDRLTAAGGVAAADALTAWMAAAGSEALAGDVARAMAQGRGRTRNGMPNGTNGFGPARISRGSSLAPALALMARHLDRPLSIAEISRRSGLGESTLLRQFRAEFGCPPSEYYNGLRLDRAREILASGRMPVADIAEATGFASPAWFSNAYKARFGLAPSRHRKILLKRAGGG